MIAISLSCFLLAVTELCAVEVDQALLKALEDNSFQVREKATKDLIDSKLTIPEIEKWVDAAEGPETRHRLQLVLLGKYERIGWVKLERDEIPKRAKPAGIELPERNDLYVVKAQHDGGDVIGKYLLKWDGGNFPVGESELMKNDFQVWIGKGVWRKWDPASDKKIPMGRSKEGKPVYAVRAEYENGTHPGMLIAGETEARISWGGGVVRLKDFEILETE